MKKKYIAPTTEIKLTDMSQMIALSLQPDPADGSEVLVQEDKDWNIWDDEE